MPSVKISELPAANPLAGTELLEVVQSVENRRATARQVAASHMIWARTTTAFALVNDTSLQPMFPAANDTFTLPTGVYLVKGQAIVTGMSATSGNATISLIGAGTAVIANPLLSFVGGDSTTPATAAAQGGSHHQAAASSGNVVTAATGTGLGVTFFGMIDVTTAGTLIPSIQMTTASAASVAAGSHIVFERIGDTGAAASAGVA